MHLVKHKLVTFMVGRKGLFEKSCIDLCLMSAYGGTPSLKEKAPCEATFLNSH